MSRARRAGQIALPIALVLALVVASIATAAHRPAVRAPAGLMPRVAAAVAWPVSTLVVSEVQTGGASASDEFAEIANVGQTAVDLIGLELVYVTSTGSTVTRKAAWATGTVLDPGRHLLVANAAGILAATADASYSGGFAATGGALVLRPVGGSPIDAVAWGDATSAFVEGSAAPAPPAGSSVERRPGGGAGNGTDTNVNSADFVIAPPNPQNLAAPATPDPTATPTPTPTASVSPTATPAPSSTPTPTPTATASPSPSPTPTPSASPTPTTSPTPSPSPSPSPTMSILDARAMPDGAAVRISGTLTTDLGAIDAGRVAFVQDATDGIAIRLATALAEPIAAGTTVTVQGTMSSYFSLRVVGVATNAVEIGATAGLPEPIGTTTGGAGESVEGVRLAVSGVVTEAPADLADGLGVTIDDGSGPLRLVVAAPALAGQAPATGDKIVATGPLGQRDSSGTGIEGYRLHVTLPTELRVASPPTPTPTPTATSAPSSSTGPTPSPSATAAPSSPTTPSPSPSPSALPSATTSPSPSSAPATAIASARSATIGSRVTVGGVVTAEAGRLGTPALIAIQDASAGIVVRLADTNPRPARGTWVEVTGTTADPYGQLEVRAITTLRIVGPAPMAEGTTVDGSTLGESAEARLVRVEGTASGRPVRATSGDLTFVVATAHGSIRVASDASAGLSTAAVAAGDRLRLTGVAGQHASRKGALDGYRVWIRDATDIVRVSGAVASGVPSPSGSPSGSAGPGDAVGTIAAAILAGSGRHTVEGSVTIAASLLDATGRRIIVQDRTAAIEVLLPAGSKAPRVGARVRITGEVGRAYGAPRLRATTVRLLGTAPVAPLELRVAPGAAHEWRLVRVRGDIAEVHRSGATWTAELVVGGARVPIAGLAGAAIPSTALEKGRTATVVGIVRRPYPSATDRRFAVVPGSSADLTIGGPADDGGAGGAGRSSTGGSAAPGGPGVAGAGSGPSAPPAIDLVALSAHVGEVVRVGGLVQAVESDGFRLDDGTAIGRVRLMAGAADIAGSIVAGDALSATGRVVIDPSGEATLAVEDPAGIALVGDLGAADAQDPSGGPVASGSPSAHGGPSASTRPASVAAGLADPAFPEIGAAGLLLVGLASLAATLLRREQMRRRLGSRIAGRLASVGVGAAARPLTVTAVGGPPVSSPTGLAAAPAAGPSAGSAGARPGSGGSGPADASAGGR